MMELSYRRHRFPPVVIQHAVWLYLRFTLSYRDVEDLLAECGLDISYETVRSWVLKFGPVIARRLRRRRPRPACPATKSANYSAGGRVSRRESQVRTGLPAGGSRIRTFGSPATASSVVAPCRRAACEG